MRTLVYLFLIALAAAGPVLYWTVGGEARARTAVATAALLAERGEVDALIRADAPPRDAVLQAAEAALGRRRSTLDAMRAAIDQAIPPTDDARLRELGLALGLDEPVVDSLLGTLSGPAAAARRATLASVLGGIEPGTQVERLHCASIPESIAGLRLARWRVELAFVAPLASAIRSTEALCSGDARRAPAILVALESARTRPDEWNRFATTFEQPPVRVQGTFDVLVDAGGSP